jgi:hypothetical protein
VIGSARVRLRAVVAVAAAAFACLAWVGGAATSAQASTTCTWGGTPAAPTGIFTVSPGLTNIPSAGPSDFTATGHLAGSCSGYMTFRGRIDAGATCSDGIFAGTVTGLPGVVRFEGFDLTGVAPSRLYDRSGNLVGSENAQLLTTDNAPFSACGTPEGFTRGTFSSVIELF